MKILLVQSYLRGSFAPVFPLGLAYLAAMLSAHEVKILDLNIESDPFLQLENTIAIFNPEVVGISLRNIDSIVRLDLISFYEDFAMTTRKIKELSPETIIIAGGTGFSMYAREIMARNPEIDFGASHEAEGILPELLDHLNQPEKVKGIFYRHNCEILYSGKRDLIDFQNLPYPRRRLFDLPKYVNSTKEYAHSLNYSFGIGVQSKRGCDLKCIYCNYPFLNGNEYRLRNPINVVDEIQELKERYQIEYFSFADNVFNAPLSHAEQICREIVKRKLQIRWSAYFDIRFISESFLVLASQAGCKNFEFSPDGISTAALKGLKKGIGSFDIIQTAMLFKKNVHLKKCNVVFYFFINPPGETLLGLIQSLFFVMRINRILKEQGRAFINWIKVLPMTDICKIAFEKEILMPDTPLLHRNYTELDKLFYSNPPLNKFDFLTRKVIKKFCNDPH